MIFSTMATKTWLAFLMVANIARAEDPIILTNGCPPLVAGSPTVTLGEVCPVIVGGNMEVTLSITSPGCLLIESHICNMDVEYFTTEGVSDYTYAIDTQTTYDFTCGLGDEGVYVVAGHATVECSDDLEPWSAYYEFEIGCPPDPTTTVPVRTRAPVITTPPATTTTTTPTTPQGTNPSIIGNPNCDKIRGDQGLGPCDAGTYVKEDCTCTDLINPCDACPLGTRCQEPDATIGSDLMCIDCECGFCDSDGLSCCSVNARGNNCKDESNDRVCNLQFDYYPPWAEAGNSCAGVEVTVGNPLNGCGCKPNSNTACTFNQDNVTDKCYVCRVVDLFDPTKNCHDCQGCLADVCDTGGSTCFGDATNEAELDVCLDDRRFDECRKLCAHSCMNIVP